MLFGEQVDDLDLVPHIVPFVLGVGNHAGHSSMGDLFAVMVTVAFLPKKVFNLLHAVLPRCIQFEQLSHHRSLGLVDHQPPAILHIAEDTAISKHHIFLNGLCVTKLHTAGQLA